MLSLRILIPLLSILLSAVCLAGSERFADLAIYHEAYLNAYRHLLVFSDPDNFTKFEPFTHLLLSAAAFVDRVLFEGLGITYSQSVIYTLSSIIVLFAARSLNTSGSYVSISLALLSYLFLSRNIYIFRSSIAFSFVLLGFLSSNKHNSRYLLYALSVLTHTTSILYILFLHTVGYLSCSRRRLLAGIPLIAVAFSISIYLLYSQSPYLYFFIGGDASLYVNLLVSSSFSDVFASISSSIIGLFILRFYKTTDPAKSTIRTSFMLLLSLNIIASPFFYQLSSRVAAIAFIFTPFMISRYRVGTVLSFSSVFLVISVLPSIRILYLLSQGAYR